MQGMSSRQQGKQPLVSQIAEQDEFNSLADEDREHIDEVVCVHMLLDGLAADRFPSLI